jgi:hypothetical protein
LKGGAMPNQKKQFESESEIKNLTKLDGVVIGILTGLNPQGMPLVVYPGNPNRESTAAKSTIQFSEADFGCEVALLFENGETQKPMVIGRIQHPETKNSELSMHSAEIDGERLVFSAEREIVLRCGKSSITLTRSGKIILRGNYLLSRSSGVNRIKGGSVQIN